jgi:hypothetical protein
MVYQWKKGAHARGDAQVVGEELESLRQSMGGQLTPRDVLEAGSAALSPLHPFFDWDDTSAAHSYRIAQAGDLMRAVVVQVDRTPGQKPLVVRAFVSVSDSESRRPVYTSVADAMSDPVLREQVKRQAEAELKAWRERYKELKELGEIFAVIDRAVAA